MNERIRELAEQIVGPSRLHGGEFALMGNKQVEKFAELIVQECAQFARQHNLKHADRSYMIHKAIEQYFGVKE